MGNCTSGTKRKKKGNSAQEDKKQPNEEVTYASIDHTTKGSRQAKATTDDDCDYATVNIPAAIESDSSSKEECADDYVLMG